jgi:hypothetical protein
MPGYNGMGPNCAGTMAGRGLGPCGKGRTAKRCCDRTSGLAKQRWNATGFSKEEEKQILKEEAKTLETDLIDINSRIAEIDK